ncbi:uncharacterized protein ora6 [Nerophis lumbriciformis]|uniref:uncharacterized protein ora6 n=1 Tax=Nerophis lumbriciformis TaxID=546530 RepID=UPI002ADF5F23|nr:uncharacterized protein LOC133576137 [Nerophis lumbriciformis]
MLDFSFYLLTLRVVISCIGLLGNVVLILSIIHTRVSSLKTFELFLMGLATANLEEILIVNIYNALQFSSAVSDVWYCRSLKFLTVFGEISSILFTVLISVYRYQKMRDAYKRIHIRIYLDNTRAAWIVSGLCVGISVLLSVPIFVMNLQGQVGNLTRNNTGCPPDFFLCSNHDSPTINCIYKYVFILLCNLLPLIIVTLTSGLIATVLLSHRTIVTPIASVSGSTQIVRKHNRRWFHRSTLAILAAMALFQVDWTLYLLFQLTFNPKDVQFWAEIEFFISTSYTSISPYVYGIGNKWFSARNFRRK